ncbi:MAG: hypothetical protein ACTHKT_10375 [Solirubrobacterales bacterium]
MSYMRSIKVWGLAFSAMLLISGLAVANASAAPQWTLNGAAITKAVATSGSGTLELTDEKGFFGNTVTVSCTGTTTGTAGPGAADTTSTVTVTSCKTVAGTCGSPSASAVNLPWKTELSTVGGVVRDTIKSDGKGAPGYKVECTVGIRVSDTCTSEEGMPKVTLNTSPVPVIFDEGSGKANCTMGGTGAGHVRGTVTVKSSAGTLTASD